MFDFTAIKNLRKKWGLTADELAERAGLTRITVTKIESGAGNPTVGTIEALAQVFGLAPSELLRMAEVAKVEIAARTPVEHPDYTGIKLDLQGVEIYQLKAPAGSIITSESALHENTAEICQVLSGRLELMVGNNTSAIGPGDAIRFKAIHGHEITVLEDADFLIIHHSLT